MNSKKILVVDDDAQILELISKLLIQYQYSPLTAKDDNALFSQLKKHTDIALIILDVMLSKSNGIELCKKIRQNSMIPIILVTASVNEIDRIIGLELGADDYIHKPFNPRELIARIQTILRRATAPLYTIETANLPIYKFSEWCLDTSNRELLSTSQVEVPLTTAEYTLLLLFVQQPKRVLSRDQLLESTNKAGSDVFDRSIDILVSRLRRKLQDNSKSPRIIKTIHGGGYIFAADVELE